MVVIKLAYIMGDGGWQEPASNARYLQHYDVDAYDGRGEVSWTADVHSAIRFKDHTTAFSAWRSQSRIKPLRPDGKANRPLTAFTVEIIPV